MAWVCTQQKFSEFNLIDSVINEWNRWCEDQYQEVRHFQQVPCLVALINLADVGYEVSQDDLLAHIQIDQSVSWQLWRNQMHRLYVDVYEGGHALH